MNSKTSRKLCSLFSELQAVGGASAIYTIGGILNAAIPFLLLPILTRYLGPTEYGILAVAQALTGLFTPLFGLGIAQALNRQFFESTDFKVNVGVGIAVITILSPFTFTVLLAIGTLFPFLVPIAPFWFGITILIAFSAAFHHLVLSQFQIRELPLYYILFTMCVTASEIILAIFLVVYLGLDWEGRLVSQASVLTMGVLLSAVIFKLKNWVSFRRDYEVAKTLVSYGLPLVPQQIALWTIALSDRFYLAAHHDAAMVGVYSVASQVSNVIALVFSSIALAWTPQLFRKLQSKDSITPQKQLTLFVIALALGCSVYALLGPIFQTFFAGEEFYAAMDLFVALAVGQFCVGLYRFLVPFTLFGGRTKWLAILTISMAVTNLVLNHFLIPKYGMVGAALATAIAYGLALLPLQRQKAILFERLDS